MATEPALALRAEQSWYAQAPGWAATFADVIPAADVAVGTLRTAAGAGARARLGTALKHPWLASAGGPLLSATVFAGARGEFVARDLFLDGNTFRRSVRVAKERWRGDLERGVALSLGRLSVEYVAVTQGREYVSGPATHTYGSIGLRYESR
jgi:hypothetical protein